MNLLIGKPFTLLFQWVPVKDQIVMLPLSPHKSGNFSTTYV